MIASWAMFILFDLKLFLAGLAWLGASARSVAGSAVATIYCLLYLITLGSTIAGGMGELMRRGMWSHRSAKKDWAGINPRLGSPPSA
jgi:hypothetical protein